MNVHTMFSLCVAVYQGPASKLCEIMKWKYKVFLRRSLRILKWHRVRSRFMCFDSNHRRCDERVATSIPDKCVIWWVLSSVRSLTFQSSSDEWHVSFLYRPIQLKSTRFRGLRAQLPGASVCFARMITGRAVVREKWNSKANLFQSSLRVDGTTGGT